MASLEQNFPLEHKNPSMRRPRDVADLPKQKEAERKKESIHGRSLSFPLASLTKQKEAERKKESIELATRSKEEESEIQPSPHNSSDAGSGDDQATKSNDNVTSPSAQHVNQGPLIVTLRSFDPSLAIDIREEETSGQHVSPGHNENPGRMDGSKIEVLEWIILLANFIVELMSIVFDQLSSQHKPFLLLCLIVSIAAVLISISELFYKLIKEWDFRKGETNWRSWLFDPPPGVRVGFFPCITALTCAFGQFIITTVNYSLYRKDGNAPIKVSIWPTIFAFGQLFSLLLRSRGAKTETKTKPEPQPQTSPPMMYAQVQSHSLSFRGAKTAPEPQPQTSPPMEYSQVQSHWPESMLIEGSERRPKPDVPKSMPIKRSRRRPKPKSAKPKGD